MLIRRMGRSILITFDYRSQAKSFMAFLRNRNKSATYFESERDP